MNATCGACVSAAAWIGSTSVRACSVYLTLFHHLHPLSLTPLGARPISLRRRFGLALIPHPRLIISQRTTLSLPFALHHSTLQNTQKQICRSFG